MEDGHDESPGLNWFCDIGIEALERAKLVDRSWQLADPNHGSAGSTGEEPLKNVGAATSRDIGI